MDINKLLTLPKTNIGKMIGDIENLDWMDFEKINEDITFGSDIQNNRNFLIIRYQIKLRKNKYFKHFQCFFQRNENLWLSNQNTIHFINTGYGLTPYQKKLVYDLIDGKIVKLMPSHFPSMNKHVGKEIATPETWRKKKAVDTIERNWIICRYEPKYKMCEQVLMNNIEEARKEFMETNLF